MFEVGEKVSLETRSALTPITTPYILASVY